jgi:hypothetical protein
MFRALVGFFNMIFLLILFKMFAPGVFQLSTELLTNLLTILNELVTSFDSSQITTF